MIKRVSILITTLLLLCAYNTNAQRYSVPEIPDSLGSFIQIHFNKVSSDKIRTLGDDIETLWYNGSLGIDLQLKIHEHVQLMSEKGYNPAKHVSAYFEALNNAITVEALDNQKLTDYVNLSGKVIKYYNHLH